MINALTKHRSSSWGRIIWFFWSWGLPAAIIAVIVLKLMDDSAHIYMLQSVEVVYFAGLVCCMFLLSLNIGFEAWKWQFVLKPIEDKSILDCIKIILAGKSLNVISPFGIGDGFSRYAGLAAANKIQIFAGLAIDRVSQMVPTFVCGAISVYYLVQEGMNVPMNDLFLGIGVLGVLGLSGVSAIYLLKQKIKRFLTLIRLLSWERILKILMLSVGRYGVFLLQFYLVFWALGNQLSVTTTLLGIAWIFLIKTLVPDMSVLGDLVKREISATLFFSFFVSDLSVVLVAGFLVWVINIVLPALLGLFFVSDLNRSF